MDGEATAPMIASVARTTLSSSDSNQRSSGDRAADELLVRAEQQVATAGEGREGRGIAWQHLVAVAVQVQVADDLGPEQAVHVGGGRDLEPGPDFFGDAGAADDVPPLEDKH